MRIALHVAQQKIRKLKLASSTIPDRNEKSNKTQSKRNNDNVRDGD